jgi:hypothetical protein
MEERAVIAMFVRHAVKDFSKWKAVYDADHDARQAAGLREVNVWRNADEPHEVVLLFEASDLGQAKAFATSLALREKMAAAGVTGRPEIIFLTDR